MTSSTVDELRPTTWDDYIGQEAMKAELRLRLRAAVKTGRMPPHTLLCAPPGAGKSSLATLFATEIHEDLLTVIAPIESKALQNIIKRHRGILFIDEVHRQSKRGQEELLPFLEFGYVQSASGRRIENDQITVVAATTERHLVIPPLYDRFGLKPHFDPYSDDEMALIVASMAAKAGVEWAQDDLRALGRATGGVPRVARQLVLAGFDLMVCGGEVPAAAEVLEHLGIDPDGLSRDHVDYLHALSTMGGQAGLNVLSTYLRLAPATLLDLERLLVASGFLEYSGQGRTLTAAAYKRLDPRT